MNDPILEERRAVLLVGAIQFVNILDFMMVMPLGPDFAAALAIPTSKLGIIGGAYTAAAAVSGFAGAFFLDKFDRRSALAVAMIGLVLGTAAGSLAHGLGSLLFARVLAGLFGGPATSVSMSIIADVVPPARRGRALGSVMAAFSAASVLGVPAGLELARIGSWRTPFLAVAGIGALVTAVALFALPRMRRHLDDGRVHGGLAGILALGKSPLVGLSLGMTTVLTLSGFLLIPNLSAYLQGNLGYPRNEMSILYGVGGIASFVVMRLVGRLVDRAGSFVAGGIGCVLASIVVAVGFLGPRPLVPVLAIFVAFMVAMSFRNVAMGALTTRVPLAHERASFLSVQSAVQHLASAVAGGLSTLILTEGAGGSLVGMPIIAALSIGFSLVALVFFRAVEQRVRAR